MSYIPFTNNDFLALKGRDIFLFYVDFSDNKGNHEKGEISEIVKKPGRNSIFKFGDVENMTYESGKPVVEKDKTVMYIINVEEVRSIPHKKPYIIGTARPCNPNGDGITGGPLEERVVIELRDFPTHKRDATMLYLQK
ncbi:MAG: hypothetical protein ABIB43_06695 [archaeon]